MYYHAPWGSGPGPKLQSGESGCIGEKLSPFDFQGTQTIKFLEHVGEGLHAHVFKVQIRGQIYALKLVGTTMDECMHPQPPVRGEGKDKINSLTLLCAYLKFRFVYDYDWLGPASDTDPDDRGS